MKRWLRLSACQLVNLSTKLMYAPTDELKIVKKPHQVQNRWPG
jgi:hypothetical protein